MSKMTADDAYYKYIKGEITEQELYDACDSDLEFYNIMAMSHGEEAIKEIMYKVSGDNAAYYNALTEMDEE